MNLKLTALFILFFLLLTGCSSTRNTQPAGSITGTDGLGRSVTLKNTAQRIVSLAPSNTEILFAIGAGAQVVGRDESSDFPDEAASVATVGGWSGFNTEAILALQPDLVLGLAGDFNTPELAASLEQLGLTVYYLPNPTPVSLEDIYANIETVGDLTGHVSEAADLIGSLHERVTAVDEKITSLTDRPLVFFELDATEPARPYTSGPDTFIDLLINRAGGTNLGSQLQGAWVQVGIEELLVQDPDIIILGDSRYGETPEKVAARTGWDSLQAIQQGMIYPVDDNLFVRPGPRLVDGLEEMARLLHPTLFK